MLDIPTAFQKAPIHSHSRLEISAIPTTIQTVELIMPTSIHKEPTASNNHSEILCIPMVGGGERESMHFCGHLERILCIPRDTKALVPPKDHSAGTIFLRGSFIKFFPLLWRPEPECLWPGLEAQQPCAAGRFPPPLAAHARSVFSMINLTFSSLSSVMRTVGWLA